VKCELVRQSIYRTGGRSSPRGVLASLKSLVLGADTRRRDPVMSDPTTTDFRLQAPPHNLAAWLAHFRAAPIPVLARTAAAVGELVDHEDALDAHTLAESIGGDPLMTLKVLSHVATTSRRETDVETVVAALVLLGIGPFFRHFGALVSVDQALEDMPEALAGAHAVLQRSHRAARFALGFAAHRLDPDAAVLHEAALLHDFAEVLLWCHAPALALEISQRQTLDASLRSAAVQRAVLGIELPDLQHALMRAWRLPALLVHLEDPRHAGEWQVRCVRLATRVARHSAQGWNNPALPDDVADVGALLQLGPTPALKLLREIDAD
jgi:HD-like signal output (HDOD) protein